MPTEIPRNLIAASDDAASRPKRDDAAIEAEWLSNNVPSERLELHWRYASSSIQLYERHLRSLPCYGVGPALCSYLRTRLEWFSDNKLRQQNEGILIVTVEANGEVDVQLGPASEPLTLTCENLIWKNDVLSGVDRKGALFVLVDGQAVIYGDKPLKDACESFAFDLVKTLAHSFGFEFVEDLSLSRSGIDGAEIFFVSDEDGFVPILDHGGKLCDKINACFEKLWATSSRA